MPRRLLLLLFLLALFALLAPADGFGQNPDDPNLPKENAPTPEQMFRMQVEFSFKTRDRNGDGYLDKDEMPKEVRDNLAKYDSDKDGRLSFDEYLEYRLLTRPTGPMGLLDKAPSTVPDKPPPPPPTPPRLIIVDDDELDRRPPVYRAGKLPKGMPPWFEMMDLNRDGQIALWEWRKAGKSIKQFSVWDRNDDGFITIEEILAKIDEERTQALKGARPVPIGEGLEFRERMEHGAELGFFVKFEQGKTYQMDMFIEVPEGLNPYLILLDAKRKELARDDDSGGNSNARILYTATKDRDVYVIATSSAKVGTGNYVLTIRQKN